MRQSLTLIVSGLDLIAPFALFEFESQLLVFLTQLFDLLIKLLEAPFPCILLQLRQLSLQFQGLEFVLMEGFCDLFVGLFPGAFLVRAHFVGDDAGEIVRVEGRLRGLAIAEQQFVELVLTVHNGLYNHTTLHLSNPIHHSSSSPSGI